MRARQYNEFGEPFTKFDRERTVKEGIIAHPHIGPEAIKAVDEYLERERPDAAPGEPLFKTTDWVGSALAVSGHAATMVLKKMIVRGLGVEGKDLSAHSLRKLHKTGLESGGMPESWILYLQGKSRGVYSRPEDLEKPGGMDELMAKYMGAYDKIRIYQDVPRAEVSQIHQDLVELREQVEEMRPAQEYMEMLKELFEHPEAQEGLKKLINQLRSED